MDEQSLDDQQEPFLQQLCADTLSSLEDLPGAMDDRDGWWEEIRVRSVTW